MDLPTTSGKRTHSHPVASFFFGVYSWLVKVLGQFSIIYFRGLGLRVGVRVWVRVRVGVRTPSGNQLNPSLTVCVPRKKLCDPNANSL